MTIDTPDNGTDTATDTSPLSVRDAIGMYAEMIDENGQEKNLPAPAEQKPQPQRDDPENVEDEDDDEGSLTDPDPEPGEEVEGDEAGTDDEDTPDDDEDDAPEAPQAAEPAPIGDDAVVVMADGTRTTVAELKKGNLRQADYTHKTTELQQAKAEVLQFVEKQQQDRVYLQELAKVFTPQRPPIEMSTPGHPTFNLPRYNQLERAYEEHMGLLNRATQQFEEAQAYLAEQARQQFLATRQEEGQKFLDRVPEMRDKKKQQRFWSDAIAAGETIYGYSKEELEALNDHRDYMVLNDALKWHRHLRKQRIANLKGQGKPQVAAITGGSRRSAQELRDSEFQARMKTLSKTHSQKDGVKALIAAEAAASRNR